MLPMTRDWPNVRIDPEVIKMIDDVRHPTQSRTSWINHALMARALTQASLRDGKREILDLDWVNEK